MRGVPQYARADQTRADYLGDQTNYPQAPATKPPPPSEPWIDPNKKPPPPANKPPPPEIDLGDAWASTIANLAAADPNSIVEEPVEDDYEDVAIGPKPRPKTSEIPAEPPPAYIDLPVEEPVEDEIEEEVVDSSIIRKPPRPGEAFSSSFPRQRPPPPQNPPPNPKYFPPSKSGWTDPNQGRYDTGWR